MPITVGVVSVDVIPNVQGIYQRLRDALVPAGERAGAEAGRVAGARFGAAMAGAVPSSVGTAIGRQIGEAIGRQISSSVSSALVNGVQGGGRQAVAPATRAGDDTAGAFARAMRARLTAAFRAMPKLDIALGDTGVDAELARVRSKIETLSNKRIGIDIDAATADAQIAQIEADLINLAADHPNIAVRADATTALAQLRAVREEIARLSATPGQVRLETDGSFGARLRASVAAAQESLPEINVTADTDPASARIQGLRAELASLADARVGIDIDAATALARVAEIRAALTEIAGGNASIDVRVDATRAEAQLAEVQAEADSLDSEDTNIRVKADTAQAQGSLLALGIELGILAAIQIGPAIAAGIGAITAAAVAGAVGVGVLAAVAIPAITSIKNVLALQSAAQQESTKATNAGASAAVQAQQKALQLAGAQQALASAERNGGRQIAQAQQQVTQARQQVTVATKAASDAQEQAAQQNAQAAAQIVSAQQAVVAAEYQAQVATRDLTAAQTAEVQAERDLTQARADATRQLQDMNDSLVDAQLASRDAALQVESAQQNLTATQKSGSGATQLQRDQAQLAYDQAVQHLAEQTTATQRLTDDTAAANKAGVDGSKAVVSAQQAVAQAQQTVTDKTKAAADAQDEVLARQQAVVAAQQAATQQQVKGAEQVAQAQQAIVTAQQRVQDAIDGVAQAQQQAADSITSAHRQIESANLSSASSAGTAETAQDKYNEALAKLSPTARGLLDSFLNLKSVFLGWSAALQPEVLPLLSRALDGAAGSITKFTPLVHGAAGGVGELEDRLGRELKTPFWSGFLQDLQVSVGPAIVGIGTLFGNIFKGIAGIVDAFLPHMTGISAGLDGISGRFARFGANLRLNPAFQGFLDYVRQSGPSTANLLGQVVNALLAIGKALAPISQPVLQVVAAVAKFVGWLAQVNPGLIQAAYFVGLLSTAVGILTTILSADPLVLIGIALALVVDGLIEAYKHVGWFRAIVDATWHGIAIVAMWLWTEVLRPAFDGIVSNIKTVGAVATWLWQNAIVPAFDGIVLAGRILLAIIVVGVIAPIMIAFNLLAALGAWLWRDVLQPSFEGIGAAAVWLWRNAISPAFDGISTGAQWLWRNVLQPVLGAVQIEFRAVAESATWLWQNALQPAFSGIGAGASWLWDNAIGPAFRGIASGAEWLWKNGLEPAFTSAKGGIGLVGSAFQSAVDLIGSVWSGIEDVAKKPINFVIQSVYTDGIKAVWDKVADFVKLPHLPDGPKLLAAGGTVGPGWGAATPMVVNRPTAIVGEGNPAYPEYVIPTDPRYRTRALALHAAAAGQLLAGGGILGGIWDGITDAAGTTWDWAKDGAALFAHPGEAWDQIVKPIASLLAQVGDSPLAKAVAGVPAQMVTGLKDKVTDFLGLSGGSGAGGTTGVERWIPTIQQALGLLGQAPSSLQVVLRRMQQESGGDPTIVNRTDSNWLAGTPSVGLMQVIGPTFAAYADSFKNKGPFLYGTSTDPLANTYAGLNYALHQYGSLDALSRPGGYDSGGYLPTGLSTVYNGTGRPEPVFTSEQWDSIARGGVGGGGLVVPVTYNAPMPEDPQKAAMEIGRRVAMAVAI